MKSGCLIKGIIISTIFLAIVFYIFINKYDEFVKPMLDNFLTEIVNDELGDELSALKSTAEKDSLQSILRELMQNVDITVNASGENVSKSLTDIAVQLKNIAKDSIVTKYELDEFLKLSEKIKEDERSKKNGN